MVHPNACTKHRKRFSLIKCANTELEDRTVNVLIFSPVFDPQAYEKQLKPDFPEVNFLSARNEGDADDFIVKADALIGFKFPDEIINRARNLQWIQMMTAGTDSVERLPSFNARKDILLTSVRGIHGPQVSELAVLLMIALNRKFPQVVRNQDRRIWQGWASPLLKGKKVGIVGVGAIGKEIAHKCKTFEMTVLGVDPYPGKIDAVDCFFHSDDLHAVMSEVDFLISSAPSTTANQDIFNALAFSKMKSTAYFINLGRGALVDEDALFDVLRNRKIAGAALDTFKQEPLPPDHPFWRLDNLIITPHIAGRSDIYVEQAVEVIHENLMRFLSGEKENMLNIVPR